MQVLIINPKLFVAVVIIHLLVHRIVVHNQLQEIVLVLITQLNLLAEVVLILLMVVKLAV